jgi:hypothetical protein
VHRNHRIFGSAFFIGCFAPPPAPVSEAPEYRRRLRERAPHFGALAIEPVESGTRHYVSIARRRNINGCAVKLQAEPITTPVPSWCHLMWSKELTARKGICALSPATWFCLADGASTFPLCGSSAPFLLVIDLRERLPVGVLDDEACPAVHNVEGNQPAVKAPNWRD